MQKFKSRTKLYVLLALFVVPYCLAYWLYHAQIKLPTGNHGQLLKPTLSFADLAGITVKPRQWYLLYLSDQVCDAACMQDIVTLRQVRIALNAEVNRVHRWLLLGEENNSTFVLNRVEQPDLNLRQIAGTAMQTLLRQDVSNQGLYIMDPHGQAILFYGSHLKPKPIYQDLKRLLKYG